MLNMYGPTTYKYRDWIKAALDQGWTWDSIMTAGQGSEDGLKNFLEQQKIFNFWNINIEEWKAIVQEEWEYSKSFKKFEDDSIQAMIMNPGESNNIAIPTDQKSSWQLYRNKLLKDGFKRETVEIMEKKTHEILRQMNGETIKSEPVKGMVVGNVQSGKTANMAALMAMAADYGWNMFIILSGTIDNLRKQTQNRLWNDLNQPGNAQWIPLEHLKKKASLGSRAQDLYFAEGDPRKYFTVCLKNSTRLKDLIQWLQDDKNKQRQMYGMYGSFT